MILVFIIIIVAAIIAIPVLASWALYRWLNKKGQPKVSLFAIVLFWGWLSYNFYFAFYPPQSFYAAEFKKVTSRVIPDAHFVDQWASYPDIHGTYETMFLLQMQPQQFSELQFQIQKDKRFHTGDPIYILD